MNETDIAYHATWKASSGHPGGWRVTRQFWDNRGFQEACGPSGKLRLFKTFESANRVAIAMQKHESP